MIPEVKGHYGHLKHFIGGHWVDPLSGESLVDTNPATGKEIATFSPATEEEVKRAVEEAEKAFLSWRDLPLRDRARYLFDLRAAFERNFDELARILVQDHGRTINEARGSIRRSIENIESACSTLYLLSKGEHVDQLASGIDEYLVWEPVGVFLIITPGNIPVHSWSSFVPYALACGCTVVWSPSWQCPVIVSKVVEVMEEVGFPKGVINMVYIGKKFHLNDLILSQPPVKGVGFIGSSRVGELIFKRCGELGKRASINGNGKNHIVIMPDAELDKAVQYVIRGCFGMTGQRCLGTDNVVIVGDVYHRFKEMLKEACSRMKLGYGLMEDVELGPLTTKEGRERVINFIEKGLSEGAKLLLDGRSVKVEGFEGGYFLAPTILEDVHPDMYIAKEESFGPVANLIRADSLDEVIGWINTKTGYGHSACIITTDGKAARRFIREVEVGNVGVNVGIPQPYAFFPLGSKKRSFFGIAHSRIDSFRLFMDQKTVTLRWV